MRSLIQRVILTQAICVGLSYPALAGGGSNADSERVRPILEGIQARLARLWSYQCTQIAAARDSHHPGFDSLVQLACDSRGRGLARTTEGLNADSYIWDGEKTFELRERTRPNGRVVYSVQVSRGSHYQAQARHVPWVYLGGELLDVLHKALAEGMPLRIKDLPEGTCRVEVHYPSGGVVAAVLHPSLGYSPIVQETYIGGQLRKREEVTFDNIDPGAWFPVEVKTTSYGGQDPETGQPRPGRTSVQCFVGIVINDPDFEKLLTPRLPEGTEVYDKVRGVHYIVGQKSVLSLHGPTLAAGTADDGSTESGVKTTQAQTDDGPTTFETIYRLNEDESLKRIAPPFPPQRKSYLLSEEPDLARMPEDAFPSTICLVQRDGRLHRNASIAGSGFLPLSLILETVCGLGSYEYSGPDGLLELQLPGDWIVRQEATKGELLHDLEGIIRDETGRSITFAEDFTIETGTIRRWQVTAPPKAAIISHWSSPHR